MLRRMDFYVMVAAAHVNVDFRKFNLIVCDAV